MSRIGACFLAVCRGKVSEGIDFADADARAVVITGIPYPSVFDPKVSLKKKFLDGQKTGKKTLSGTEWYNLEAFRAINQAVGRVIRHKDDFGAVLLLDKRFGAPNYSSKLSSWLPTASKFNDFKKSVSSLETFFSQHTYVPKPKPSHSNASKQLEKKRPLGNNAVSSASVKSCPPPSKKQKIVIKARSRATAQQQDSDCNEKPLENEKEEGSKKDIQHFVLSLKERLEKRELKEVIGCVRVYKEKKDVRPLAEKLLSLGSKLRPEDVSQFGGFVRSEEDKRTFDSICLRRLQ